MKFVRGYFNIISGFLTKEIDATGLALFRIAYSLVLIGEISQIIYFRHLIYDKVPFIDPLEINVLPGLIIWMISVIFILFGFYTRKAALVNYVLSLVFIGTIKTYEYHVFYAYMGVNFLFLFLDISRVHAIDRLRVKLKYSSARYSYDPPNTTSAWHYFFPIAVSLGFVYFDSIFFKLASYNWTHGLGMWLPASLSMATHVDATPFLNLKWMSIGLGFITVIFEFAFLFTFFMKRFRIPLLVVGLGLHLGITIIFPIPWFGLTALAVYLLMMPVSYWRRLFKVVQAKSTNLTVYYDENCPLCNRTRISLQHFDYRNRIAWKKVSEATADSRMNSLGEEVLLNSMHAITAKGKIVSGIDSYLQMTKRIPLLFPVFLFLKTPGIYHLAGKVYTLVAANRTKTRCTDESCGYSPPEVPKNDLQVKILQNLTLHQLKTFGWGMLLLVFIFFQINITFHSKLIQEGLNRTGIQENKIYQNVVGYSKKIWGGSKILFGITRHAVFMDEHFEDYNHILAVEAAFQDGSTQWLPIINKDGTAGWYDYSFLWVKWTFRVMDNHVDQALLEKGIRDFSTFWTIKNGYELDEVVFNIYVKRVEYPKEWERDFMKRQKMKPWKLVGEGYWHGSDFILKIPEIETIR